MKTIVLVCLIFLCVKSYAQGSSLNLKDTVIVLHDDGKTDSFTTVQIEAKFPGGQNAWQQFLITHIHPEVAAKHKAPPGNYTVTVSFLVDKEGKVTEAQIIKDPGYGTANDVLKAFKHMPDWIPAMQNGKNVIYRQKQNITYQVTDK